MKTYLTPNAVAITGYELTIEHDDGHREHIMLDNVTNDKKSIILPENPSNRKFWAISRLTGEQIELTYKESKTFGPRESTSPRKGLEEYLEGDDKEMYLQLVAKAKANREMANKPMTKEQKLRAQIEELKAQIARMTEVQG